jgi:hypothetical protein
MSAPMRRQSPKSREEPAEPLGALLDHLGQLLAEYVAILMSARPPEGDPEEVR